jgi:biotin carboxyl carrier protein
VEFCYLIRGIEHSVHLEPLPDGTYIARIADRVYRVQLQSAQAGRLDFRIDGRRYEAFSGCQQLADLGLNRRYVALIGSATSGEPRETRHYELTPVVPLDAHHDGKVDLSHRRGGAIHQGSLEAHMPGQVSQVMVSAGDRVASGQPLLVLEAMKMSTRVVAPMKGRISRLLVREGDTVERGQRLVEVEPTAE